MRALATAVVVLAALLAGGRGCAASDAVSEQATQDSGDALDPATLMTRSEWKQRVEAARARSRDFIAKARAGLLTPYHRSAEERANEASAAALSDQSLRHGDIVSTTDGLFVYTGRSDADPQPGDFVPIPSSQLMAPARKESGTKP